MTQNLRKFAQSTPPAADRGLRQEPLGGAPNRGKSEDFTISLQRAGAFDKAARFHALILVAAKITGNVRFIFILACDGLSWNVNFITETMTPRKFSAPDEAGRTIWGLRLTRYRQNRVHTLLCHRRSPRGRSALSGKACPALADTEDCVNGIPRFVVWLGDYTDCPERASRHAKSGDLRPPLSLWISDASINFPSATRC